jgi:enoyl-CoA hydratase/carnithine racemase
MDDIRAVILTREGKVFCAGADFKVADDHLHGVRAAVWRSLRVLTQRRAKVRSQ